jgi:hypothetical protein
MLVQRNDAWGVSEDEFPRSSPIEAQLGFLLRYAILAPSVRNTQPWAFSVQGNRVHLIADIRKAQPVADPDRRELHISLGCALENLLVAAEHFGFGHRTAYFPERGAPDLVATVTFEPGGTPTQGRAGATPGRARRPGLPKRVELLDRAGSLRVTAGERAAAARRERPARARRARGSARPRDRGECRAAGDHLRGGGQPPSSRAGRPAVRAAVAHGDGDGGEHQSDEPDHAASAAEGRGGRPASLGGVDAAAPVPGGVWVERRRQRTPRRPVDDVVV